MYDTLLSFQNALSAVRAIRDTLKRSLEQAPQKLLHTMDESGIGDEISNIGDSFNGLSYHFGDLIDFTAIDGNE